MDPLTQGLLGASFGQAVYGKALGRKAAVWGAVVGMAPDLDVVLNPTSPMAEWLWHRGPTHSLWFGPVVGPLVGWLLWRWKGGRLRDWIGLAILALFTHPLLDVFTTYGTQLLSPFSRHRFALDAVAIIDPAYSLVLAAGLAVGVRRGFGDTVSRVAAGAALVLTTGYLLLGLGVNHRAETIAAAQLAAEGVEEVRVSAYPTLLQLPLRRLVARSGSDVRVGWLSVAAPGPIEWARFEEARGPLVEAARGTWEGEVLEWFAMGQTSARVEPAADGSIVEIDDIRYGLPAAPRDGFWGVRVRLDGDGRPLGPGERFNRRPRIGPGELLALLWHGALGTGRP
jgi:inner membrane protein